MEKALARYFIAIVPPEPIYKQLHQLKIYCFEKYNTKGALRSPPHVTLHMAFIWKEAREDQLIRRIQKFCEKHDGFNLSMAGFSCFPPRVVFVAIAENKKLQSLQRKLVTFCRLEFNLLNANYRKQPFHPHITIAFRDLKKNMFEEAWNEFMRKPLSDSFTVNTITLLKHDGQRWKVLSDCALGKA
ncbi:MAG: RNA 2',3'-cyclic phosphodiesterase [Cytophagales bacterium]